MMIFRKQFSKILLVALMAMMGAGCGKEARKNRYLSRANRDFVAEQYDKAEVEYLNVLKIAPLEPTAISRLGLIYYGEGKLSQAYEFLKKAAEVEPENMEARTKLGLACLSFRKMKEAREQTLAVLEKQPGNGEALILLADCVTNSTEVQHIMSLLEGFRQRDNESAGYHVALATLYLRQQEIEKAESEVKKAMALDPKSSAAYQSLGTVYLMRKDLKQAEVAFKAAAGLAPWRSVRRLAYAGFKVDSGATEEGKKIAEEITQKAPDYLPAWTFLAKIAFAEGKYEDCSGFLKKVEIRDLPNYEALMLNGKIMLVRGEGTNAVAQFERVLRLYSANPQAHLELARAHLVNGDINKCVGSLKTALASDPELVDAILMLADINIQTGESSSAIVALSQLVKRRPQIVQGHLLLASAYAAEKNFDDSMGVLHRMMPLFPENPKVPYLLGTILLRQNKQAEARQAFEKSLELSPKYIPALEQLIDFDLVDKQYDTARTRVKAQMEKQPNLADPWLLVAKISLVQGKKSEAETALLKAAELEPNLRNPYLLLAQLYRSSDQPQKALETLNKMLLTHTNDAAALTQIGMIQTGLTNFGAARDAYENLLRIEPKSSVGLNNLAAVYSEHLGQLEKGYELARRARELAPEDPATADTLGWIFYQKGDYARALSLLQESAAKLPTESEVQFHLGMTHYMMGEEAKARVALQKGAASGKDFPGKIEAGQRLATLAIDVKTADGTAVADLEKRIRQEPKDTVALNKLAAIQEREGAFEKAAKTYEQVLKKQNPQNVEIMSRLARLYADHLNERSKALELAKDAHSLAPDDAAISQILGRLAYQTGDYKWALSLLQEAARKLSDLGVKYDLAWAYYGAGQVSEAEAMMETVLQPTNFSIQKIEDGGGEKMEDRIKEDARLFVMMVHATRSPATAKQVADHARQILAAKPNYIPALMVSALALEEQGKLGMAKGLYETVLVTAPSFAPASRNLAILCTEHFADAPKAYEFALRAREAYPEDAEVARALGILLYRKGKVREDFTRSAQLLTASAETLRDDAQLMYYLGMAQYQIKRTNESKKALERALALNVEPKLAEQAKRALQELN